jgi:hypothetical protein
MANPKKILKNLIPSSWKTRLREAIVARSVTHVSGPKHIPQSPNQAVVTCVVRNGEFYVEAFIRHYRRMGVRHIVFLDNGSTDRTLSLAQKFENVTIVRSSLGIQAHQRLFKRYLAKRFAPGSWCLDADIDEFFDFPGSDRIGLDQFLEYLVEGRHTAVVTQLLDMFAPLTLADSQKLGAENLSEDYSYYDISNVTREPYFNAEIARKVAAGNLLSHRDTQLLWGGIRETLWGNHCLLTKHSLFLQETGMQLFSHVHFLNYARVADVSCAMLHYKLAGDIMAVAEQNRSGFAGNGKGYNDCIEFLKNNPGYQLRQPTAVKLVNASQLVDSGFLFASENYSEYVKKVGPVAAGHHSPVGVGR